jgi:hypothetical protein
VQLYDLFDDAHRLHDDGADPGVDLLSELCGDVISGQTATLVALGGAQPVAAGAATPAKDAHAFAIDSRSSRAGCTRCIGAHRASRYQAAQRESRRKDVCY